MVASYEAIARPTSHVRNRSIGEETEMNEDTPNYTPTLIRRYYNGLASYEALATKKKKAPSLIAVNVWPSL